MLDASIAPGCFGKTPYASKAEALRTLAFREKRIGGVKRSSGRGKAHAYKCPSCGAFHLGTQAL
jgi:hypothetical protein